jgi:sensor c-di-GMP phosphodiesterase-like protein
MNEDKEKIMYTINFTKEEHEKIKRIAEQKSKKINSLIKEQLFGNPTLDESRELFKMGMSHNDLLIKNLSEVDKSIKVMLTAFNIVMENQKKEFRTQQDKYLSDTQQQQKDFEEKQKTFNGFLNDLNEKLKIFTALKAELNSFKNTFKWKIWLAVIAGIILGGLTTFYATTYFNPTNKMIEENLKEQKKMIEQNIQQQNKLNNDFGDILKYFRSVKKGKWEG